MNMNNVVQNSIQLAVSIFSNLPPQKTWAIVNIGKSSNLSFYFTKYPNISTVYGYKYDYVPCFLENEGVIEAKVPHRWFTEITESEIPNNDSITRVAHLKGYLNHLESTNFYSRYSQTQPKNNFGPYTVGGQFSILVNVRKMYDFCEKYLDTPDRIPKFNEATKCLEFLGESLLFIGKAEQNSLKLLLSNLNSIVSKQDFFESGGNASSYADAVKRRRQTLIHDPLEKRFIKIKKRIMANKRLGVSLVLVQQNGFGMFLNNKAMSPKPDHITE